MPTHATRFLVLVLAPLSTLGCPSKVEVPPRAQLAADADESEHGEGRDDEYAPDSEGEAPPAPGAGRPDETNGVCRLYAPELPNPKCCDAEYGFDAQQVQSLCGHPLYLGESAHFSCGYWFHSTTNIPVPFRLTMVNEPTVDAAVKVHERALLKTGTGTPTIEPVPGVRDAVWVHHNEMHWAFIPGWKRVRQLAWRDESCSREAMPKVIETLRTAKEPPKDAPRLGLVPKRRE